MKTVYIFTDGACRGNPGPGGWAAIMRYNNAEKVISGRDDNTTNNRMELTAVISALYALKEPCNVVVTTDSKYVCDGINQGWASSWKSHGWRKADKKQAQNTDLWDELLSLTDVHDVIFSWVKGHNGHPENEICDRIATLQTIK